MPTEEYILSLSYGKDSMACLRAIELLGWPLDRIITADVWATDTIPADPPPMVEFKAYADEEIKRRWGIEVEHYCACNADGTKRTYEQMFYHVPKRKRNDWIERPKGWPMLKGPYCQKLKRENLELSGDNRIPDNKGKLVQQRTQKKGFSQCAAQGANKNTVQYLGIAADEQERIERHTKAGVRLPLVEIGWEESYCGLWCQCADLLSPVYFTTTRGGCWFCHNQGVDQLRKLRQMYPEYWALFLKWDADSPVSFHADGHTVHDFDKRFALEDAGVLWPGDSTFKWSMLDGDIQLKMF